jgi:hypothetical protein
VHILFLGRDGSPRRPFAGRYADIDRGNGGLGEPALPEASGRADHPWSAAVERGRSTLPETERTTDAMSSRPALEAAEQGRVGFIHRARPS